MCRARPPSPQSHRRRSEAKVAIAVSVSSVCGGSVPVSASCRNSCSDVWLFMGAASFGARSRCCRHLCQAKSWYSKVGEVQISAFVFFSGRRMNPPLVYTHESAGVDSAIANEASRSVSSRLQCLRQEIRCGNANARPDASRRPRRVGWR